MNDTEVSLGVAREQVVGMIESAIALLPNLGIAVLVFLAFLALAGWVQRLARTAAERADTAEGAATVFARLSRWTTVLLGALVALMIVVPDFTAGEFIGALGLGSVAIGFAFRDVLQNFLAGLLILIQQPFRVGDEIVINDFEGTVENIETRSTAIRTYDNRRVVMPNGELFTNAVVVNTAYDTRRSEYDVGVGYDTDLARAKKIMLGTTRGVDGILAEPEPEVLTVALGDSAIVLRLRWWTASDSSTVVHTSDRVVASVGAALADAGVDIPYPVTTVLLHQQETAD